MSGIPVLMQRLDGLLQAGGWDVRHDIPDVDKRGLPPEALALIPQIGRVYGRQNAILRVEYQTSCTIAGYVDEGEAEPTSAELASGRTDAPAVPVTVFDVEIDEKGQIQLTEILFDLETNSPKKAVTAIDSVDTLCDRVVQRTEIEIARRIAPPAAN